MFKSGRPDRVIGDVKASIETPPNCKVGGKPQPIKLDWIMQVSPATYQDRRSDAPSYHNSIRWPSRRVGWPRRNRAYDLISETYPRTLRVISRENSLSWFKNKNGWFELIFEVFGNSDGSGNLGEVYTQIWSGDRFLNILGCENLRGNCFACKWLVHNGLFKTASTTLCRSVP